jgi:hypothetical protein
MAEPGFYMPVPGESNAPVFDPAHPSQIRRYFAQLECLFARADLLDDHQEMKFYTTFFIDSDLASLWEAFPEFNSASSTFDDFKTALIQIYAGYSKYILSDLDSLISEFHKSDICSFRDLSDYHLHFQEISSDLIASGQLDSIGQILAYPRGFPPKFWSFISQRLSIQFPDHRARDPFPISDVYDAARFILHAPSLHSTPPTVYATSPSVSSPAHSPLSISAPSVSAAPASTSPVHSKVSVIIENLKDNIVATLQTDQTPSTLEIKPQPIVANPAHHISVSSSEASPYIPSSRISSAADSDRIAHLEKELEILRAQQAIFAHSAPLKLLDIPGYEPPHVPNFGSVPPRRPKLVAPPVICAQPPRSPPGLPAQPSRPPAIPKRSPDIPLAIRQSRLSPNAPHLASDTLRSPSEPPLLHPAPLHISESSPKSSASITLGELLSVAPEITLRFDNLITAPSDTVLISTSRPQITSIYCLSSMPPQSIASSSPVTALSSLITSSLSSSTALSLSFPLVSFTVSISSLPSLLVTSSPCVCSSSFQDHISISISPHSFPFTVFVLLLLARLFLQFICSLRRPRIMLRTPGEPPPPLLRIC